MKDDGAQISLRRGAHRKVHMIFLKNPRIALLATTLLQHSLLKAQDNDLTPAQIQQHYERNLHGLLEEGILIQHERTDPHRGGKLSSGPVGWSTGPVGAKPLGGVVNFKALAHKVPKPALQAFKRGEKLLKAGNHQQAAAAFALALQVDPGFAVAAERLGIARAMANENQDAFSAFDQALAIDPALASAHHNRAILSLKLGQLTEAEQGFRQAISLSPSYGPARFALGFLLWQRDGAGLEARELMASAAGAVPGGKDLMKKIRANGKRSALPLRAPNMAHAER